MRLVLDKNSLGSDGAGLEIGVKGFKSSPTDADSERTQVYIEIYEGKLKVHVWDGSSEDPSTVEINPIQS
jgi:hypothetical protein